MSSPADRSDRPMTGTSSRARNISLTIERITSPKNVATPRNASCISPDLNNSITVFTPRASRFMDSITAIFNVRPAAENNSRIDRDRMKSNAPRIRSAARPSASPNRWPMPARSSASNLSKRSEIGCARRSRTPTENCWILSGMRPILSAISSKATDDRERISAVLPRNPRALKIASASRKRAIISPPLRPKISIA